MTPKPGQLRILLEEAKEEMNGQLLYGKDSVILCREMMDVRSQLLEVSDKTVLELGQGFGKETW